MLRREPAAVRTGGAWKRVAARGEFPDAEIPEGVGGWLARAGRGG